MRKRLTVIEHLEEFRQRLVKMALAFVAALFVTSPFCVKILVFLKRPASGLIDKLAFFSPQEAFSVYMRVAFFAAFLLSLPVILYQVWQYIALAISRRFRYAAIIFIFFATFAFLCGCACAYFILIPPALKFLMSFAGDELVAVISAQHYISFVVGVMFACGLVFQMPILSYLLGKLGVITPKFLRSKYSYAIVIIFIAAAIITPTPDPFNMLVLALPMVLLYEISIWVCYFAQPKNGVKSD